MYLFSFPNRFLPPHFYFNYRFTKYKTGVSVHDTECYIEIVLIYIKSTVSKKIFHL
jgi:hypothetical protein